MGAKVRKEGEHWTLVIHHNGKKKRKRIGTTLAAKREAESLAKEANARLALGDFKGAKAPVALPFDQKVNEWHAAYSTTFLRPSTGIRTVRPMIGRNT